MYIKKDSWGNIGTSVMNTKSFKLNGRYHGDSAMRVIS